MYIAIPMDSNDFKNANITTVANAKVWAIIEFDEGEIKSIKEAPNWSEHGVDWLDFVILENRFENSIDFLNEGITVLVRRESQDSIDTIIEAFKFKELDEAGF
jgi:predicted Fe-Mo cluster-binding NifX family protein